MRPILAFLFLLGGCIVPESAKDGSNGLQAKAEKEPDKYISDSGKGVAFVRCVRDDSFFASPGDLAKLVADGCQASLSQALLRYPEVVDIDPIVVDGTTVGYSVLYDTPEPVLRPAVEPNKTPLVPINPPAPEVLPMPPAPEPVPAPAPAPAPVAAPVVTPAPAPAPTAAPTVTPAPKPAPAPAPKGPAAPAPKPAPAPSTPY